MWSFWQNTLYLSQVSGLGGHGPSFWLCILPPPPTWRVFVASLAWLLLLLLGESWWKNWLKCWNQLPSQENPTTLTCYKIRFSLQDVQYRRDMIGVIWQCRHRQRALSQTFPVYQNEKSTLLHIAMHWSKFYNYAAANWILSTFGQWFSSKLQNQDL